MIRPDECADPDILEQAFNAAIGEAQRELLEIIRNADSAGLTAAVADLNATVDSILEPQNTVRSESCFLPPSPTANDVAASVTGMTVIDGKVYLPGPLDLTTVRRIADLLGTEAAERLLQLDQPAPTDPQFGSVDVPTSVLLVETEYVVTSQADNVCNPDDVVETTVEQVVGVNKTLTYPENGHAILVWIGDIAMTDGLRGRLTAYGLSDEDIANAVLQKSSDWLEVHQVRDPTRLGTWLKGLDPTASDRPTLAAVLASDMASVDDRASSVERVIAVRKALEQPAQYGCGLPPALALATAIRFGDLADPDADDCDDRFDSAGRKVQDTFEAVNKILGATGVVQKAIDSVMNELQKQLLLPVSMLSDVVSVMERYVLSLGTVSASLGQNNVGASFSAEDAFARAGSKLPTIPAIPNTQIIGQASHLADLITTYQQVAENVINATARAALGVSLLACTASAFGEESQLVPPELRNADFNPGRGRTRPFRNLPRSGSFNVGLDSFTTLRNVRSGSSAMANVRNRYNRLQECQQSRIDRQLDISALSGDVLTRLIQTLLNLLVRLRALRAQLLRGARSPISAMQLQCSLTETAQLAQNVARQMTARNFGRWGGGV